MDCFACELGKARFYKNDDLIKHIASSHKNLQRLECRDHHCTRKFDNINSFRKHRKSKHFDLTINDAFNFEHHEANFPDADFDSNTSTTNSRGGDDDCMIDFSESKCPFAFEEIHSDMFPHVSKNRKKQSSFKDLVTSDAESFVAYCYSRSDINRKRTQELVDNVTRVLNGNAFSDLKDRILSRLEILGESADNMETFQKDFSSMQNPFENFSSDYRIMKHFQNQGVLIMPEQVVIGEREEYVSSKNKESKVLTKVKVTFEFIPLRTVLKQFFEIPGVLSKTLKYIQDLNNDEIIISNFIQGDFWKGKASVFDNRIVFPGFLYFDDYETNDALGSHAGISKCGAVYICLPALPIEFQSKKENIFLFFLFNSLDRKQYGNKILFQRAFDELNFLQKNGISVQDGNSEFQIFFQLGPILGDNLGLNGILGFVESFGSANHSCRLCCCHKSEINDIFKESQCKLRDHENYNEGVMKQDVSSTGIKEECIFNVLEGVHVTENICVDVMHDALEGIVKSDVPKILHHFIHDEHIISLDHFNERLIGFNFDMNDRKSKPPPISLSNFNSKTLSMSASETLCFLRILPLLIADKIAQNDDFWNLILVLRNMLELLLSKKLHKLAYRALEVLVEEYLKLLKRLFPDNSFRPKHHNFIHYPRIFALMGPIVKLSSMRFENKHRDGKSTAHATSSRVNICRTIALQNQFSLAYRFLRAKEQFIPNFETASVKLVKWEMYSDFWGVLEKLGSTVSENIARTKHIEILGEIIEEKCSIIAVPSINSYKFVKVEYIILEKNNNVIFLGHKLNCRFNLHYDCYEILPSTKKKLKILTLKQIYSNFFTTYSVTFNSTLLIVKKWY